MKENFEKEGLVLNKERVLTYSKLKCPLGCRYCFSEELSPKQEKGVVYLSDKQLELLKKLPEEIELIMLGCDTEFLQNPKNALEILRKLTNTKKDISIITKLTLTENFIKKLLEVDKNLKEKGNLLVFSMSVPCLQSASFWEPKVSAPEKRIDTLKQSIRNGYKNLSCHKAIITDTFKRRNGEYNRIDS